MEGAAGAAGLLPPAGLGWMAGLGWAGMGWDGVLGWAAAGHRRQHCHAAACSINPCIHASRAGPALPLPRPTSLSPQAQPIQDWLRSACLHAATAPPSELPDGLAAADWACVREQAWPAGTENEYAHLRLHDFSDAVARLPAEEIHGWGGVGEGGGWLAGSCGSGRVGAARARHYPYCHICMLPHMHAWRARGELAGTSACWLEARLRSAPAWLNVHARMCVL